MIVTGAKGFAVQLYDVLLRLGEAKSLIFYDDLSADLPPFFLETYTILKSEDELLLYMNKTADKRFVLGTGNPTSRKMLYNKFIGFGASPHSVIASDVLIGTFNVKISEGVSILSNSIIESTVEIGKGTLVNLNVLITHHSIIGQFCELSPGVRVSGRCIIGNNVFVGTGAIILPGIKVGDNCVIGAGAVITKDIPSGVKVVGVPGRIV